MLAATQKRLRAAYYQAVAKGFTDKAEVLRLFIGEEEYVPETTKARRNMVREGSMRTAIPARHEVRA